MTKYVTLFNGATPFSDTAYQMNLAATTALSVTIPGNSSQKYRATFSFASAASVWVGYNVTATLPSSGAANACHNVELRPQVKFVNGGDVLSFISTAVVTDAGFILHAITA
jgi:hypothetical protein